MIRHTDAMDSEKDLDDFENRKGPSLFDFYFTNPGTMSKDAREHIVGPDSGPEPPFPLRMRGKVVSGFGRGSKEVSLSYPLFEYPRLGLTVCSLVSRPPIYL
jgi:hypothetical protein